jgi:hypothetical protein
MSIAGERLMEPRQLEQPFLLVQRTQSARRRRAIAQITARTRWANPRNGAAAMDPQA